MAGTPSALKKHKQAVHDKIRMYKCSLCEHSTGQKENLKRHMDAVHYNLKKYKCDQCEFSANHKFSLNKHKDNHQGRMDKEII
jgi:KRAB domain-containing zinc finger protein